MNPTVAHDSGTLFGGISIGAGLLTWMDVHANALGVLVALMSGIAYIVFMSLSYVNTRSQNKTKERMKREIIDELLDKSSEEESEIIKRVVMK